MCFWSVNLSTVSCHQSSTVGSLFALIFITLRQPHPLLVNYLNLLFALTWKKSITINKAQTSFGDSILNDLKSSKIKIIKMKRVIDSY